MLYGISGSVTALTEASRHLLKRQGKKLKRHGAVTLGRFGGNTDLNTQEIFQIYMDDMHMMHILIHLVDIVIMILCSSRRHGIQYKID